MKEEYILEFNKLSLPQKIEWFKKHKGKFTNTKSNEPWFSIIQKELMMETYNLPARTRIISNQEISGFLIYSVDHYQKLVDSYNPKISNWDAYFVSFMKNRYMNYIKPKQIARKKEEIIISSHLSYEYTLRQEEQDSQNSAVFSDSTINDLSIEQKKLIYILKKSKTIRKRLFIFLLSCTPILEENILRKLCRLFFIDYKETKQLVHKSVTKKDLDKIENRIQLINSRRNYNYSQALFYRKRYCDSTDEKFRIQYNSKHQSNLEKIELRTHEMTRVDHKVNNMVIANLLGLKRGTVSSSISIAKQVLEYCLDSSSSDLSQAIPAKIAVKLNTGKWLKEYKELDPLDVFYPSKVFTIV